MRLLACLFLLATLGLPATAAGGSVVRLPANRGLLLKLAEEEEDFGVSGPYFPSSSFGAAALRLRLDVAYAVPTTGQAP